MSDEPRVSASPWYAAGQLQRAVDSLKSSLDAGDVAASDARIARWRAVVAGMTDGSLTVGSRTPVAGTQAWVTPEVAHGGFATGRLLAETPPDAGERDLLARFPAGVPGLTSREQVNLWFLGDAGQRDLLQLLAACRYRIEIPEEAGLPVVAWLLERDQFEAALDLVSDLRPWVGRPRFTPHPAAGPVPSGAMVRAQAAGTVAAALNAMQPRPQITVMRGRLGVRRLVAVNPDAYAHDLAIALNTVGNCLQVLARWGDALPVSEEAVEICRRLVAVNPEAYEPTLATALDNLGSRLAAAAQEQQDQAKMLDLALARTEEASRVYRRLSVTSPARFEHDSARTLTPISAQEVRGNVQVIS